MIKIGIIGGSGLDDPKLLKEYKEIDVITPYGKPSSSFTTGKISDVDVVILARHGKKHTIMPSNVPNSANIYALKEQGVTHIIATSACGSLRDDIKPGDFVLPDQFIDRTTKRISTFYEKGQVCHIPVAEPFCEKLRKIIGDTADKLGFRSHKRGTVITIEGPRFSTKAESHLFRSWKADVINMSTVPECGLAREAGICYQVICMSTDYDCWKESDAVDIQTVLAIFKKNAERVKKLIETASPTIKYENCSCKEFIKTAIVGGK